MSKKKVEGKKIFKMHASLDQVMVQMDGKHSDIVAAFAHAIWNKPSLREIIKDAFEICEARKNDENNHLEGLIRTLRKIRDEMEEEEKK